MILFGPLYRAGLIKREKVVRMKALFSYGWLWSLIFLLCASGVRAEVKEPVLSDNDCIKCHDDIVSMVKGQKSAHRDKIGCLDCHKGHPPAGKVIIPKCSMCHDPADKKHFTLKDCKRCHNPHAPIITDFAKLKNVAPGCITCHPQPGEDLKKFPSAHSKQDCNNCHTGHGLKKGRYHTCTDCHKKHADNLTIKDCLACHSPHKPAVYIWTKQATADRCAACHKDIVKTFKKSGGAHLENLQCIECHEKHPPHKEGVIPKCQSCHNPDENRHFTAADCTKCHDPHAPMEFDLSKVKDVKPACATCHEGPVKEMKLHPSAHAKLDCNACHRVHGQFLKCTECHDPHSPDMKYEDCLKCHQPHAPTLLEYGSSIKPALCGACHQQEAAELETNTTKHHELNCAFCHRRRHKSILTCVECHGEPHRKSVHKQYTDCHTCHGSPHALQK